MRSLIKSIIISGFILIAGSAALIYGGKPPAKGIPGSDIGKVAVCPVLKTEFKVTKNSAYVDYEGKRYYFCCPGCDKKFMKDPAQYLDEPKTDSVISPDTLKRSPDKTGTPEKAVRFWICPMHTEVRSEKAGSCPVCGMDLIPIDQDEQGKCCGGR